MEHALAAAARSADTMQLIEIGGILAALGLIAFAASRLAVSPVPFFLLAGLMCGRGGVFPLEVSQRFLSVSAEIGALLLLLLLGLEYSVRDITRAVRSSRISAFIDLANAIPGVVAAFFMGWGWVGALALGGITYVSSSGIAAQLIRESGRRGTDIARRAVGVLVLEDLLLAPYLPLVTAVGAGLSAATGLISVSIALVITGLVLLIGASRKPLITRTFTGRQPNALLLTVFGTALLAGGLANLVGFSGAVAAFLVGLVLTGELAETVRKRLSPLRDLFAALFFLFFGLSTNPADVVPMIPVILSLAVPSAALKFVTGWWAARGLTDRRAGLTIGAYLVARGEFSIVIAGLVASQAFGTHIQTLTVGYVIATAIIGSLAVKLLPQPDPMAAAGSG